MPNTKIIVCYHKKSNILKNEVLLPIHVGKAISNIEIDGTVGDNTGENISSKNGSFCELTGLYWLWKNVDADNYGLFHYRRFLDIKNKYTTQSYPSMIDLSDWSQEALDEIMSENDIVLPHSSVMPATLYEQYKSSHIIKDLDICIDILRRDYPQYEPVIEQVLNTKEIYFCNMFIMKKELFNEYCEWVFDILSKAEKQITTEEYDKYNKRVFGFLSERLLNIFIAYKKLTQPNLKIKEVNLIWMNEEPTFHLNLGFIEFKNFPNKIYLRILFIKISKRKKK
jgi:hypothetical protein